MLTVYKYRVPVQEVSKVVMPIGAQLLHFGAQGQDEVFVWALVDTGNAKEHRVFFVRGTGHDCDVVLGAHHLATVFAGSLVWHIFDGWTETS